MRFIQNQYKLLLKKYWLPDSKKVDEAIRFTYPKAFNGASKP
jgi:hypothetical protein